VAGPLVALDLSACAALRNVDGLRAQARVTRLDLTACRALTNVRGLSGCTALEALVFKHCDALADLDGLAALPALREIDLLHCGAVTTLDGLAGSASLRRFKAFESHALVSISALAECPSIETVDVGWCRSAAPVDIALLRAFAARPGIATLAINAGKQAFPLTRLTGEALRALVESTGASALPRALPAVPELTKEEKAALKAVPAILAVPTPMLKRLCAHAGLHVTAHGTLGWNTQGLKMRQAVTGDVLLALADAVGLLDGIGYLSLSEHAELRDLGALARHADTLRFLRFTGADGKTAVLYGEALAAHLHGVEPFPAV
jgi:hypothetical protein